MNAARPKAPGPPFTNKCGSGTFLLNRHFRPEFPHLISLRPLLIPAHCRSVKEFFLLAALFCFRFWGFDWGIFTLRVPYFTSAKKAGMFLFPVLFPFCLARRLSVLLQDTPLAYTPSTFLFLYFTCCCGWTVILLVQLLLVFWVSV